MVKTELKDKRDRKYYGSGIGGPGSSLDEVLESTEVDLEQEAKMPAVEAHVEFGNNTIDEKIQTDMSGK